MPFLLIRNDIAKVKADAVVNTANTRLEEGPGASRAIYLAAGEEKLREACRKIGGCELGKAVITPGFQLPAKYIIHAVGPVWQGGGSGEEEILAGTYRAASGWRWSTNWKPLLFRCSARETTVPGRAGPAGGYPGL